MREMKIRRDDGERFLLEVSHSELEAFQAGLRETLEALDDWEFQTRTGMVREEMRAILMDLVAGKKSAEEAPPSD